MEKKTISYKKAISMAKAALKAVRNSVKEREDNFLKKTMFWQDSVTGDNYSAKTEQLRELADAMEEQLTYF